MSTVTFQELAKDTSSLLNRVEAGEHLIVIRDGHPVAVIRPIEGYRTSLRPVGLCAGAFTVPDDFDEPLPEEILREFEGQ